MNAVKTFWQAWKKFGMAIGDFVARVILTAFYFTIFLPFGLGVRLFADRLDMKTWQKAQGGQPHWIGRSTTDQTLDDARKQG